MAKPHGNITKVLTGNGHPIVLKVMEIILVVIIVAYTRRGRNGRTQLVDVIRRVLGLYGRIAQQQLRRPGRVGRFRERLISMNRVVSRLFVGIVVGLLCCEVFPLLSSFWREHGLLIHDFTSEKGMALEMASPAWDWQLIAADLRVGGCSNIGADSRVSTFREPDSEI